LELIPIASEAVLANDDTIGKQSKSPPSNDSLTELINKLYKKLPTGPVSAAARTLVKSEKTLAWTTSVEDGKLTVYLPQNLESLGDNPLVLPGLAACYALKPNFEWADEEHPPHQVFEKKQELYLSGVAWALREGEGALAPYHDASGAMGHGFYWVCHHTLEAKLNAGTWWAKGSPWHLTKGMTGKAWSSELDAMTRRVNALLSKSAASLRIDANWATWVRSKESFLGKEIKKSLPHTSTELLTEAEKEYLSSRFAGPIKQYRDLLAGFDNLTVPFIQGLAKRLKEVGSSLHPLSILCDEIISHRITNVYPREKRARRLALKRPIRDLIQELDNARYINVFDPGILGGRKPFSVYTAEGDVPDDIDLPLLRKQYQSTISGFKVQGNQSLYNLCSSWADAAICPLKEIE
jgi:hypothetical protein